MAITRVSNSSVISNTPKKRSLLAGNDPLGSAAYYSIATAVVDASGSSSITFSNIPQTYTHLQIRAMARCNAVVTIRNSNIQFNGDTGSNYSIHELSGNGASTASAGAISQTSTEGFLISGSSVGANIFGVTVIDILDYANANKNTTLRALSGMDYNGAGSIYMYSGVWLNKVPVTSINFAPASNYIQYSSFALYGIK
jgi:hypothetical protein